MDTRPDEEMELLNYLLIYQKELSSLKLSWWRRIVYGLCSNDHYWKLEAARFKKLRAAIVARELAKDI